MLPDSACPQSPTRFITGHLINNPHHIEICLIWTPNGNRLPEYSVIGINYGEITVRGDFAGGWPWRVCDAQPRRVSQFPEVFEILLLPPGNSACPGFVPFRLRCVTGWSAEPCYRLALTP